MNHLEITEASHKETREDGEQQDAVWGWPSPRREGLYVNEEQDQMKRNIQEALRSVGVFGHYRGYHYFTMAVMMAAENPERLHALGKEIYLPIAEQCGTSVANVEKDIRTIRDVMMRNGGEELLAKAAGCAHWKDKSPYPKEIISIFAEYFHHQ